MWVRRGTGVRRVFRILVRALGPSRNPGMSDSTLYCLNVHIMNNSAYLSCLNVELGPEMGPPGAMLGCLPRVASLSG